VQFFKFWKFLLIATAGNFINAFAVTLVAMGFYTADYSYFSAGLGILILSSAIPIFIYRKYLKDILIIAFTQKGYKRVMHAEKKIIKAEKELVEEYAEAARWGQKPPAVIVRSHRHRYIRTSISRSDDSEGIAIVTPGWQAKTPFAWKMAGARITTPQFGGILIRQGDEDLYVRPWVRTIGRSATV